MKSKSNVLKAFDIVRIVISILLVAGGIYLIKTGNTFYVSGYFIHNTILVYTVLVAAVAAEIVCSFVGLFSKDKEKTRNGTVHILTGCFMIVMVTLALKIEIPKYTSIANEMIELSDGSKVFINEKGNYTTYLDVYQINGIMAKNIEEKNESRLFSRYCIEKNKWDYTYDETNKKLTLIFYYDGSRPFFIDEEDDTGSWEYEFTLE